MLINNEHPFLSYCSFVNHNTIKTKKRAIPQWKTLFTCIIFLDNYSAIGVSVSAACSTGKAGVTSGAVVGLRGAGCCTSIND